MAKYEVKYYKGLGTSNNQEAKEYFSNLKTHVKTFLPMQENDKMSIDLAFNKKRADNRKNWLKNFVLGTFLDTTRDSIFIKEFVDRELILFSLADNVRSIPSVMDGLKPGQRKVLYTMFSSNEHKEIKVVQLAGKVAERSAYHHGEASLAATIVNLAHNFVGSNNINLLMPNGQFGSRLQGGKDAASPRYIYTQLNKLTRLLFKEDDDALLNYLDEDNQKIEPSFYVPIIPMVLVNGADGIGTGWSTNIPCFCPKKLCDVFLRVLRDCDAINSVGSGSINKGGINNRGINNGGGISSGLINNSLFDNGNNIEINTGINSMINNGINGYINNGTINNSINTINNTNNSTINSTNTINNTDTINNNNNSPLLLNTPLNDIFTELANELKPHYNNFKGLIEEVGERKYKVNGVWEIYNGTITITELPIGQWTEPYKSFLTKTLGEKDYGDLNTDKRIFFRFDTELSDSQAEKKLKLSGSISLNNIVCFDSNGYIRKYEIHEILREFYGVRMDFYKKRYDHLISVLRKRLLECESRVRFIKEVVNNTLIVMKRKKSEIVGDLQSRGYPSLDGYDYLLDMSIASLTVERIESLNKEHSKKKGELDDLLKKNHKMLWEEDLVLFAKVYGEVASKIEAEYEDDRKIDVKFKSRGKKGVVSKGGKNKEKDSKGKDSKNKGKDSKGKDSKKDGKKDIKGKDITRDGKKGGKLKNSDKVKNSEEMKKVKKSEKEVEIVNKSEESEELLIKRRPKTSEDKKPWEKLNYFLDSDEE